MLWLDRFCCVSLKIAQVYVGRPSFVDLGGSECILVSSLLHTRVVLILLVRLETSKVSTVCPVYSTMSLYSG